MDREPICKDCEPERTRIRNDHEPEDAPVCKPASYCLRAASATRGRIVQVSESERRWWQTRRAPNACFRTAGASRVTAGSQAGRKRKKKVGNPN
jgi:hypothetical protein